MSDPKNSFDHADLEAAMKSNLFQKGREIERSVFVGKILNNNDPEKLGRCQVLVYGVFDEVKSSDLPWAIPDFGLNGEFVVPDNGTFVSVVFQNEDVYAPCFTTKVINRNALSDARTEDYPNTIVIYDDLKGNRKYFNRKTGESVEKFANGVEVNTDINGNMTIDTTACTTGNITLDGRAILKLDAPIIDTPAGTVVPAGTGFMNALLVDPITGLLHSGHQFIRT